MVHVHGSDMSDVVVVVVGGSVVLVVVEVEAALFLFLRARTGFSTHLPFFLCLHPKQQVKSMLN